MTFDHTRDPVNRLEQEDYKSLWKKYQMTIFGNMRNAENMKILKRVKLDN